MIKQIYQPLINALNYEKSVIDEIAKGAIQYNISHSFDFSSNISATLVGGHNEFELLGELSEIPILTSQFANAFESQISEPLSLQLQFINQLESELNQTATLTFESGQGQPLTATLNLTSSIEAEFSYLLDFTKNISETISMDRRRTHYVWDGGIILQP